MSNRIAQDRKDEILTAIKNGIRVIEASEQFSVSPKTIYAWLRAQTDNTERVAWSSLVFGEQTLNLNRSSGDLSLEKKRAKK